MSEIEKIYYTYMDDISLGGDSEEIIQAREVLYEQLDKKVCLHMIMRIT